MTVYADFLASKTVRADPDGPAVTAGDVHPFLHDWQRDLVVWAVRTSRAALWTTTGTGKSVMAVEWARLSGRRSLIVAPLAVCHQTVREAAKVGVAARYVRSGAAADGPGVWVTNYEMVTHFDPARFGAVVLDESSALKHATGKLRATLINHFAAVPHRLACSATPAPNDMEELTSQAEFLGRMRRVDMLAAYFVHDAAGWRLKGHARAAMFAWMATWARALRRPSDMGGDDTGYVLPGLNIVAHLLPVAAVPAAGQLFPTGLGGVGGRAATRRATLQARCGKAAALVAAEPGAPWLLWCGLNAEADMLTRLVPGAVNVHGAMTPDQKADRLLAFADGAIDVLVTKPEIASLGMNFQRCSRMAFVGLSDSFQSYFQAIRRCYRYGQTRVVDAHIVLSELESPIAANIARKERDHDHLVDALITQMRPRRDTEVPA